MKYRAKPVIVDAYKITAVVPSTLQGAYKLTLDDGETAAQVEATPEMTARFTPKLGDYWIVQSDGYTYLNPKDVFERKYEPLPKTRVAG